MLLYYNKDIIFDGGMTLKYISQYTLPERLFIIATVTIVLPFFISGPILAVIAIALIVIYRKTLIKEVSLMIPWLIFFAYAEAVALLNYNFLGALIPLAFLMFMMLFWIYRKVVNKQLFIFLMKIVSVESGLISLHAIGTYFKFLNERSLPWTYIVTEGSPQFRAESFFFNANYFGLYIAMGIVVTIYWLTMAKSLKEYSVISLILIFNGISVILTASRMLIPTVVVGAFVILWFNFRKTAIAFLIVGGLGIIAIILNPSIFPRFESLAYGFEDRFMIWSTGWGIFKTRPLTGRGPLSYINFYYLFTNEADMHSHQLLIDFLANYGFFGLLIFINALTPYIRTIGAQIKLKKGIRELALVIAMIVLVLVHGLMDVSIMWLQTGFVCLLVASSPIEHFNS